ncbi:hypothetical protein F5887DRAFT_1061847 [Amanita rubescens]|nr:hypothetical protein F5887DRAFT_1061847 [Amanita rubescens]
MPPHAPALSSPPSWFPGHGLILCFTQWRLQRGWDPNHPGRRIMNNTACEHIVVLNKRDLVSEWGMEPFRMATKFPEQRVLFASWHQPRDIRNLSELLVNIAKQYPHATEHNVLVVGMPNVGKSTLLNALRNMGIKGPTPKAFRTSVLPGLTQSLSTRLKISLAPLVYAFDSPGVMLPFLGQGTEGAERGAKLALIAGIKEGLYDMETLAAYLLYRLNVLNPIAPAYLHLLRPSTTMSSQPSSPSLAQSQSSQSHPPPTNDITEFLTLLARRMSMIKRGAEPDLKRVATYFVRWWREEGGLIAVVDSGTTHASLDMMGSAAAKVEGEPRRTRTEDDRVTVQGWGFDFEWRVEKEQVVAGLASKSAPSVAGPSFESSGSSSQSDIPTLVSSSIALLSPGMAETKMKECINAYLARWEVEEREGRDVSKMQRRKREVEEQKQRRVRRD